MKTMIFSVAFFISGTAAFAQDNRYHNNQPMAREQAPQKVEQAWQRDHPNAGNPNWQKGSKHWDANYHDQSTNRNVDTYYDKKGRVVDTHTEWDRRNLPRDFDNRIRDRYHTTDYSVYRIDRPASTSLFQIILNIGGGNKTVYLDEQGNEVKYKDRH